MPECIITGCAFLDVANGRWIWGDLHLLHDILIHNSNGCDWKIGPLDDEDDRAVRCDVFYEKNSQIVFPLAGAQFNLAANKFLTEWMPQGRIITLDGKMQ